MRARRAGLLSALLLLPACGSVMSWSFPPLARSGSDEIGKAVPAPYAGIAIDLMAVADGTLIFLLDLPFSLVLDTAVLPLTLTTWLFRQLPDPQHHPPPLPAPTGPPRAATVPRPPRTLTVGTPALIDLTGEPQQPERFEVELTARRRYVVQVTATAPATALPIRWVWVTPRRRPGVSANPGPDGVRLPASGAFVADRTERWGIEVWGAPGAMPTSIQVLVRGD